jgi:prepilin-type processing-associated H-X9-DG protein
MYHDNRGTLPYASWCSSGNCTASANRQSWPPLLWPFIEQDNLYRLYDFNVAYFRAPNAIDSTLDGAIAKPVPLYYCPSDLVAPAWATGREAGAVGNAWRSRGNYVLNWGPVTYQTLTTEPLPTSWAPFGFMDFGTRNRPRLTRLLEFTDGTSNTLLLSEQIKYPIDTATDRRGDIFDDDGGGNVFMTLDTPNNGIDALKLSQYCKSLPPELPCTVATGEGANASGRFKCKISARSRHNNGVNVGLADGSVRFVSNGIGIGIWQALSTMNGGEVINDSSF